MMQLTDTIKKMLAALALADAGEMMSTREKLKLLHSNSNPQNKNNQFTDADAPVERSQSCYIKSGGNSRRIALYMGSELPEEVMSYVMDTCTHLRHDLTVLSFEAESVAKKMLQPYVQPLAEAGVDLKLVHLTGDPIQDLDRYLRRHPEIAFLACKDTGYIAHRYMNGLQENNTLPVPVVVVTTKHENELETGKSLVAVSTDRDVHAA